MRAEEEIKSAVLGYWGSWLILLCCIAFNRVGVDWLMIYVGESFVKIAGESRQFSNSVAEEAFNVFHGFPWARFLGLVEEGRAGDRARPLKFIQILFKGYVAELMNAYSTVLSLKSSEEREEMAFPSLDFCFSSSIFFLASSSDSSFGSSILGSWGSELSDSITGTSEF